MVISQKSYNCSGILKRFLFLQRRYVLLTHRNLHHNYKKNLKPEVSTLSLSQSLHTSYPHFIIKDLEPTAKELAPREAFFRQVQTKDKKTYLKIIETYNEQDKTIKRGHIEFIYAALKYMEDFGVDGDLEVYKKLMDVFPKGKMIPKNLIQAEFYHFSRHQECAIATLDAMEHAGVCPDLEVGEIIKTSFGVSSYVYKKFGRMLYFMPKLKYINPYLLPDPLPDSVRELARLALKKMNAQDVRAKIEEFDAANLEESVDKTWILSAQSPVQRRLIEGHPTDKALFVEGPNLVWLRKLSMSYFVLRAEPKIYPVCEETMDDVENISLYMFGEKKPKSLVLAPQSLHEQEDGIFMAMCCTGTSSKDSVLSWIRFLREKNPKLDTIPILFKMKTSPTALVAVNVSKKKIEDSEDSESLKED